MKFKLIISFILTALSCAGQIDTTQRHDWREQFKKKPGTAEFANMVPDSTYTTVKRRKFVTGQVISICAGTDSHWYPDPMEIGVIKIYSASENFTYCVLTSNKIKYNYVVGDKIVVEVAPLKKNDKYFKPRQITCDNIMGDIICISKK